MLVIFHQLEPPQLLTLQTLPEKVQTYPKHLREGGIWMCTGKTQQPQVAYGTNFYVFQVSL